ncbi:long-chain-fatty-acid--AMP ligase FadD26-like [Zingiber officinale]|nr:long-chain-fatty-acid--AMP ligase FadD26-like [Zingiber officinale]
MSCENYDPCFPDQPVVDRYLPIWASQPSFSNKPAFVWAKDSPSGLTWTSLTYSDLNAAVEAMASKLLCSLNRGDVILVLCSPGLRLVKVIFACQRAGLVAVPLVPPDLSLAGSGAAHHHLLRAISQAKPKAAVADRSYVEAVRSSASSANDELVRSTKKLQWLSVEHLEDSVSYSSSSSYSGCGPDDTYLIQYTSGATGVPKPVLVTAGAAAHNVRAARTAYDLQPSSVIVSWLPQYHDCGLMFLLLTVVSGATCVLASPVAFLHRPRLWLELVTEFRATCTPVPAFALPLTVKRGSCDRGKLPLKLGSLTNLIVINEPVYKSPVDEFIEEFSAAGIEPSCISPSYGLAENCTYVSTSWPREELGGANRYPNMPSYKQLLPSARLGKPYAEEDIVIVVVDEATFEPVEDGVEGEIWVSSASNASGYLGHPSLTREVFNARILGTASRCFVRTGDRGVVRGKERYLYVTGRSSDVIVSGEKRLLHPHYIEHAAHGSSPRHLRGGCIVAFGEDGGRVTAAAVLVAELQGNGLGMETCRKICEAIREGVRKEEEGVSVGRVVLVEKGSIPKTTSGKPRRWLAKRMLMEGSMPFVFEARFEDIRQVSDGEGRGGRGIAHGEVASSSAGGGGSFKFLPFSCL